MTEHAETKPGDELSWALMIPIFFAFHVIFPREHAARVTFEIAGV